APTEGKADVAARAYVLLGQVEEHLGRFEDAAESYRLALRQKPAYELAFSAEVGRAIVLGLDTDRSEDALRIVRGMRGDDKHYQRRAELALVEARIRARIGQSAAALSLYRDILYNEELGGGTVRGETHYRLSEFYRNSLNDYVRASAHLDTAATALRVNPDDRPPARGAVLDVADEARTYSGLATSARRIAEVDSLMALGALSDEAFRARIDEIETERRRVWVEDQRRIESERRAQEFSGGGGGFDAQPNRPATPTPGGVPAANAGFLSFRSPASVQSGLITFQQRWGDRPLVPNWRRRAAVSASAVAADRGTVSNTIGGDIGFLGGPEPLDLFAIPRTPAKRQEMVVELAGLRYELANAFFLQLGQADTASALYRTILEETPDLAVAVRARYALAEIERAAGRDDVARPLYEFVLEADSLELGRASRERLGLLPLEDEAPSLEDASASMYDAARQRWRDGDPLGGAADMIRLADLDPEHPVAPRAYFAAASAFIDWADADSLTLRSALPDSLISEVLFAAEDAETMDVPSDSIRTPALGLEDGPVPVDAAADPAEAEPDLEDDALDVDEVPSRLEGAGMPAAPVQVVGQEPETEGVEGPLPNEDSVPEEPQGDPESDPADVAPTSDVIELEPVVAPADSLLTAVALEGEPSDSSFVTVADHLREVAARYPSSLVAERATLLATELTPLPIVTLPVTSDSTSGLGTEVAESDSTGFIDATGVDSAPPPDSVLEDAEGGLRGSEPLDPDLGGFTWKVRTLSIPDEGASTIGVLQEAGFRSAVLQELETRSYIIAIGQFEMEGQAKAVTNDLPAWARFRGEVVRIDAYAVPADNTDI
ncbi:MAG: hypothetical protein WBA11_02910, partial [Rubrivirga sp.]